MVLRLHSKLERTRQPAWNIQCMDQPSKPKLRSVVEGKQELGSKLVLELGNKQVLVLGNKQARALVRNKVHSSQQHKAF